MERFSRAWDNINSCIVHVRELSKSRNGAKCDCICVECNGALEALQGDVNEWSFRHQVSTICKGGPMTALHKLAQELLCGDRTIKIRGGEVSYLKATNEWIIPESLFRADVAGIKADGSRFLIEIFVTHNFPEGSHKSIFIREQRIHCIEINLSKVDPNIDTDGLLALLLNDVTLQNVIYSQSKESNLIKSKVVEIKLDNRTKGLTLFEWLMVGGLGILVGKAIGSVFSKKRDAFKYFHAMEDELKYWETLLVKWRGRKLDGLTIPFIIGSQEYLPASHIDQSIDDLVKEIVNNTHGEFYITYCMNIDAIILGLRDESKKGIAGFFPFYNKEHQTVFFVTSIVDDLGNDIETIISSLKERFQNQIDSGNYSRNDGEWTNYSDSDKKFITDCFKDL